MGWTNDDAPDHEGYVVAVLRDGREVSSYGPGDQVTPWTDGGFGEPVPESEIVRWAAACSCGWRVPLRDVTDADRAGRSFPWLSEDEDERVFLPLWREHTAPFVGLAELERAVEELDGAQSVVDKAVASARGSGASWSQIARAVRMTKQGAQQRWS